MMGHQPDIRQKLFYICLNLENRIRKDHVLRTIATVIDFDFIYKQVKDKYGTNGNASVTPPVILKMLLLIFYKETGGAPSGPHSLKNRNVFFNQ